jgi:D-alanyl-D-alanine carboxypeptidase/D-alanyl-D-alanine-endopeptidase (penicillin-binding protein 4)
MRSTFILLLLAGCSPALQIKKEIRKAEAAQQDHIGFLLYDPQTQKKIIQHNDERYFTPASNTKIFTIYASVKLLGDSLTALEYVQRNDSTIFWGLGDPSFLNPLCHNNPRVFSFLQNVKGKLIFSAANFNTTALGNGWSWDDYNYSYSAERTPFAVYGNLIMVKKTEKGLSTEPKFFEEHLISTNGEREYEEVVRDVDDNQLVHYSGQKHIKQQEIPFHFSGDLLADLFTDTLKRQVEFVHIPFQKGARIKSIPVDSIYRVMMQDSDNMMAEQLLLQCAAVVSDTLQPEIAIRYTIKNLLPTLPDKPQWVDGSGLSRFNLFTPRSIAHVWEKLYKEVPHERLFKILAVGGQSGTLKNYYKSTPPYVFGKTGTLSNNHSLSGYLLTKKGKTLIFSWMNNNFVVPTSEVRKKMESLLAQIRDHY